MDAAVKGGESLAEPDATKAAQKAAQQAHVLTRDESQAVLAAHEKTPVLQGFASGCDTTLPPGVAGFALGSNALEVYGNHPRFITHKATPPKPALGYRDHILQPIGLRHSVGEMAGQPADDNLLCVIVPVEIDAETQAVVLR